MKTFKSYLYVAKAYTKQGRGILPVYMSYKSLTNYSAFNVLCIVRYSQKMDIPP